MNRQERRNIKKEPSLFETALSEAFSDFAEEASYVPANKGNAAVNQQEGIFVPSQSQNDTQNCRKGRSFIIKD
jgi:hypothetical protein